MPQTSGGSEYVPVPPHTHTQVWGRADWAVRPHLPLAASTGTHTHTCHPIATARPASISPVSTKWEVGKGLWGRGTPHRCPHLPLPPLFYTWLAPPFLPAGCRKQQHAGTSNLERPLGSPTPAQASLKRVVGVKRQLGTKCPIPTLQSSKT